jgi:hypothetical protein
MVSLRSCVAVTSLVAVLIATPRALQTPQPKPSAPARDNPTAEKPGTAVIKGRVSSIDGRPLRRAQVRVTAPTLRDARTASTDTEGHYELTELPEGRYTVRVTRSGFLSLSYGQKYPGELGTTVEVRAGQTVSGIDIILPKAGVIAGRVLDEVGDPISGVMVFAMQQRYFEGRRRLVPAGGGNIRTDDTGQYRLIGLPPGDYYVLGTLRESWVVGGKDKTVLSFAPTYFPGSTSLPSAQRVRLGIGQEVAATDFALVVGRAASVAGIALGAAGTPMSGGRVMLNQEFRGPGFGLMSSIASATAAADGSWKLANVAPGEYKLEVRNTDAAGAERATQTLHVDGTDIEGLMLAASAGGTISGQVVAESGTGQTIQLSRLRVTSRPVDGAPAATPAGQANGAVDAQGKFQLEGVAGAQRLNVTGIPDGWALKRIERESEDLTDTTLNLRSGERLDDVRVVLTDRLTIVAGTVLTDKETPSASGTIVVFADDASRWGEASRYVRAVRPTQAGEFEVKGLPPGDYRAMAIEYLPEGDWNDPDVLASFRDRAVRFALAEDERRTISLRLSVTSSQ